MMTIFIVKNVQNIALYTVKFLNARSKILLKRRARTLCRLQHHQWTPQTDTCGTCGGNFYWIIYHWLIYHLLKVSRQSSARFSTHCRQMSSLLYFDGHNNACGTCARDAATCLGFFEQKAIKSPMRKNVVCSAVYTL